MAQQLKKACIELDRTRSVPITLLNKKYKSNQENQRHA